MKEINVAYEVLGNPNRRMEYDRRLETRRIRKVSTEYSKKRIVTPNFFIEFRFHDHPKRYLKWLMHEIARRYRVSGAIQSRPVPHMTLFYGESGMVDIRKVRVAIEGVAKRYTIVPFEINKFDWRDGEEGKVIVAGITTSPELKRLRFELKGELSKIYIPHRFDTQSDFWFHSVIAFKDIDRKFDQIWRYLNTIETPHISQHLARITVLNRRRRIECEYDLVLKRWLTRREALDRGLYQKTVNKLRELLGKPPKRRPSLWQRLFKM